MENLQELSISEIAVVIYKDWGKKVFFGAVPYLDAMRSMETVDSRYIAENGRDVVQYFLSNAGTWRGDVARAVKKELNRRLAS